MSIGIFIFCVQGCSNVHIENYVYSCFKLCIRWKHVLFNLHIPACPVHFIERILKDHRHCSMLET